MHIEFSESKESILAAFRDPAWIEGSGLEDAALEQLIRDAEAAESRAIAKATAFEIIARHGKIAVNPADLFQEKLSGAGLLARQRSRWEKAVIDRHLPRDFARANLAYETGTYCVGADYGHTSPNSELLLTIGISGLLNRIEKAKDGFLKDEKKQAFYSSCEIALKAMQTVAHRLADAVEAENAESAAALRKVAERAPETLREAMQLLILYFFLHEYVCGTRVRTLGRLDVLLEPFYRRDLACGRLTRDGAAELLRFFLYKFYAADVPFGLPFCLGGIDENANEVTSDLSRLVVEVFDELSIHSPKIHIRVSDKTPRDFILRVLRAIRGGNSSFVFVNDPIAVASLEKVGIPEADARRYVPIGCYEPAVWGKELGCTGNGYVSLPKVIELTLTGGRDHASGAKVGLPCPLPRSYEDFMETVKGEIAYLTEEALDYVTKIEGFYGEINPDPLLSAQYDDSVARGVDVFEGGATYNNSSLYYHSIASAVDMICAVKRLVFDQRRLSLSELAEILKANWQGHEDLRRTALSLPEKYGNGDPLADEITGELSAFCASLVNNRPNGRGGVFKAAIFTIDLCYRTGSLTMATPDGRYAGEPLSKNLCASVGMDRQGLTALIGSAARIDASDYPNGSVLDVVLHPSAVAGSDGLMAFYGLLSTYFKKGGFALHGNVFDAEILKKAQAEPTRYKNLQVRVCGWNAYFVDLSRAEQDDFIRRAEIAAK